MIEAIRMVGHLLDGRSTTRTWARDKQGHPVCETDKTACTFCLQGAIDLVAGALSVSSVDLTNEVWCVLKPGKKSLEYFWDYTTDNGRREIINKLKEYK